jgi:LmbE family N-acetylglucosaminyl deacetylase
MDDWNLRANKALEEAAERLGVHRNTFLEKALEAENTKLLAANADLLEVIRNLRLDVATLTSTLEGLQRRVNKSQRLSHRLGRTSVGISLL